MQKPSYITDIDNVEQLPETTRTSLHTVCDTYPFRSNDYYLSLINWDDPDDPIKRIIIPSPQELQSRGHLDASSEERYVRAPGLEHKYEHTAIILVSDICGGFCRFCFRKRLFGESRDEVVRDIAPAIDYLQNHPEINNVLITGGDPLLLSTNRLAAILEKIEAIDHVRIIRIGSKLPAFNPYRIIDDPSLIDLLDSRRHPGKQLYLMVHFNHPNELSGTALDALMRIRRAGIQIMNQTPVIRGVNDDSKTLSLLFNKLTFNGIIPYYVFQCRPTRGNYHLAVPLEHAFKVYEQAKMDVSGLGKISRFVMSHTEGKIQVLGLTADTIIFKVHRAADFSAKAKIMRYRRNPRAFWFDDYSEGIDEFQLDNPFLMK